MCTCWTKIFIFSYFLQLFLFFSDDTLDSIHGQQVGVLFSGPFVQINAAFPKLLLSFTVRLRKIVQQRIKPFNNQLIIRLTRYEVVLIGQVPVRLCVKSDIKSPFIIRAAVVRIEEHEDRRQLPVSVENILRRICRDIHQPLQILN